MEKELLTGRKHENVIKRHKMERCMYVEPLYSFISAIAEESQKKKLNAH